MLLYRFHPTMTYVVDTFKLTNTGLSNHRERILNLARFMTKKNEVEYKETVAHVNTLVMTGKVSHGH